jgi:hypothetical protein
MTLGPEKTLHKHKKGNFQALKGDENEKYKITK